MNISDKTRTFRNPKVWIPVSAVIVLVLASLLFWITTREDDVTYMTEKVRTGNIGMYRQAIDMSVRLHQQKAKCCRE